MLKPALTRAWAGGLQEDERRKSHRAPRAAWSVACNTAARGTAALDCKMAVPKPDRPRRRDHYVAKVERDERVCHMRGVVIEREELTHPPQVRRCALSHG